MHQGPASKDAVLAWVLHARRGREGARALQTIKFLQACLTNAADQYGEVGAWLKARSAFIIAEPKDGWAERALVKEAGETLTNEKTKQRTAQDFFRTLSYRPWSDFRSVTAFVKPAADAENGAAIDYWTHRRRGLWHYGVKRSSNSKKRDAFVLGFYDAARAVIDQRDDQEVLSNLFRAGFLVFGSEEFVALD